jgi:hypothetical protein
LPERFRGGYAFGAMTVALFGAPVAVSPAWIDGISLVAARGVIVNASGRDRLRKRGSPALSPRYSTPRFAKLRIKCAAPKVQGSH